MGATGTGTQTDKATIQRLVLKLCCMRGRSVQQGIVDKVPGLLYEMRMDKELFLNVCYCRCVCDDVDCRTLDEPRTGILPRL